MARPRACPRAMTRRPTRSPVTAGTDASQAHLHAVRAAAPEDWEATFRRMALHDFGADFTIGFVLAYFRSFAVPRIALVLHGSGEITSRPAKRSTDTGIVIYEIIANGFDSERGRHMVSLLRRVHQGAEGSNDDYLYVLLSLLIVPMRWTERHGWRVVEAAERRAAHRFFLELGQRMGLQNIPADYEHAAAFFDGYEASNVAASAAGAALTNSAMPAFTNKLPRPARRWDRALLGALIGDDRVSTALGLPEPHRALPRIIRLGLRIRNLAATRAVRPAGPSFRPGVATTVYPGGYDLSDVGPPRR